MANFGHKLLGMVLCLFKSFFYAVVQVAWGLATFFILIAMINYYKQDASMITTLLEIISFIQQNWWFFFGVIFIFDFITGLKEFIRDVISPTKAEEIVKLTKAEAKL